MRTIVVIFATTMLASAVFGQDSDRYTGPIIDMHLHAYTDSDFWGPAPNPATGAVSVDNATDHYRQSVRFLRKHNVVLAVVDGQTLEAIKPWERMLGEAAVVSGLRKKNQPLDLFTNMVSKGEVELFGEVGAIYQGSSPSDFTLMPFYAVADEFGIPVAVHTGGSFPGITRRNKNFRLRLGDPLLLEDVLVAYPDLRVYMMHAGAHFYQRAIAMMVQYPDLYADIAVLNWIPDARKFLEPFLRLAKEHGVLDRVMYGSDQMIWPEAIEMGIETVQSLDFLTLEDKKGIFYDNAARFLGLSEEEIERHHGRLRN
ncbi:MAG: amidohydrolase family protein [Bacteroidetes bacterium]|jgi:hypothetical protein|nr:amidohydrolase family protein [Bacteroidota bacterium]